MNDLLEQLQAHPVVMRDPKTLRYIRQLQRVHPVAVLHRKALELIGSDFTFAQEDTISGCWAAVIELSSELQRLFGLNRGILAYYAPYADLQFRTFERLRTRKLERPFHSHLYFLSTPDAYAEHKVSGWTLTEPYSVVLLPGDGTPEAVARQLLTEMIRQVSRRNPYDRTNPVTGNDFYGRRQLLTELVNELRQGHVCGVFGLRKTGKTSLVTELGRQFIKDAGNRVFILRDLEVLPSDPERQVQQLVSDLAKQAHMSFRGAGMRTHELSQLPSYPSVGEFRQALQACLAHVGSRDKTVVIALDEIESLVGPDAAISDDKPSVAEFLGALRSLVQEHANFNVVISGITLTPLRNATLYGRENPLFAWAKPFFVTALTRADTAEMIGSLGARMAVQWHGDALNLLFEVTGGHVFLARSFAAAVSSELSLRIEDRTVTEIDVRSRLRSWRRSTVGIIDSMLDALARFYEEELAVFELGIAGTSFDDLEHEYPNQINNLLALGLLEDKAGELQPSPWVRLSSRSASATNR